MQKFSVFKELTDNYIMKNLVLLILSILIISCAQEEQLAEVEIDFNEFATMPNSATIILYGVSVSGNTFTRILDNGYFSSAIPSDIWDFHAIIWNSDTGTGSFTGSSSCANALGIDLSGGEVNVEMSVNSESCSIYSQRTGDKFLNPEVIILDNGIPLTDYSIKYVVRESNNNNLLEPSISSDCMNSGQPAGDLNIISESRINHNLIGAFRVFREFDCSPINKSKTVVIGSEQMKTTIVAGDVTLSLKI